MSSDDGSALLAEQSVGGARLDAALLEQLVAGAFERCGVAPAHARIAAGSLVQTSLRGVDSHGIVRVSSYVRSLRAGVVDPHATPELVQEFAACAVLDAHNGLGSVAATLAMERAVALSETYGIGCVAVRNSTHLGASGHYAAEAARSGYIGIVWTNGPAVMAGPAGAEARVGNNPLAIAAPGDDEPLLLDVAFSVVARGKVIKALAEGRDTIPLGWMLSADGRPTTDAEEAVHGLGIPVGAHKGFGLALMADVLAGALAGSGIGRGVRSAEQQITPPTSGDVPPELFPSDHSYLGFGHICIALSLSAFGDATEIVSRLRVWADDVRSCPPVPGEVAPRLPGDGARRTRVERERDGIPVSKRELDELVATFEGLSLAVPAGLVR